MGPGTSLFDDEILDQAVWDLMEKQIDNLKKVITKNIITCPVCLFDKQAFLRVEATEGRLPGFFFVLKAYRLYLYG